MNKVSIAFMRNLSNLLVVSVATGISLSACGPKDQALAQSPDSVPSNETSFADAKSQADCLKLNLETEALIMDCMKAVSTRAKAIRDSQFEELADDLETEKQTGEELDEAIDGLSKVVDIQEEQSSTPDK